MGVFRPRNRGPEVPQYGAAVMHPGMGGKGRANLGPPQAPRGPPPSGARRGPGGGGKGGFDPYGGPPPPGSWHPGPPVAQAAPSIEQVLPRAHDAINTAVWEAVQEVMRDCDLGSSEAKLAKRITNYIYKAVASPDLMTHPWDEICRQIVKGMFQSYSTCKDSEWFYQIDLVPALSAAAMVVLPCGGWRVPPHQVFETMSREMNLSMDRITLERALWEMVESLYGDDEKVRTKIFNALSRSYEPALTAALADPMPMAEITRVEAFAKRWIDDCICRAWGGLGDQAEEILTHEAIVDMFDHLLRPFGEDHPFSAVPSILCEGIGAPPPGWDFIPEAVQNLFDGWANRDTENMPARKRRKKASADPDEDLGELGMEAEEFEPEPPKVVKKAPAPPKKKPPPKPVKETMGHPDCTSAEDCAGSPEDGLVQHVLEDGPGDLYCQVCWNSFIERNPDLEGVPVDE